jgi:hypothetical protein
MRFDTQYYRSGAWHNGVSDSCEYIDQDGYAAALFHAEVGPSYRVRVVYGGDSRNSSKASGWMYLRSTS